MSAEWEMPDLHADLPDILRLVAELATVRAMGPLEEVRLLLKWAETGYNNRYGAVPLDKRIELAQAWIDLARITHVPDKTED
jgi:hypothetical protein